MFFKEISKKSNKNKNLEINNSISLGTRSGNIGDGSSTFGFYNEASGTSSFASGNGSIASNNCSHAEGSHAKAKGLFSHAEGDHTEATGKSSHAEGSYTVAKGESSHAEGDHTEAGYYAHVQGKYNIKDVNGKYAHIVGNGTLDTQRSNAHTVDWSGNAWYQGNVYIGGTGQDDVNAKKLATEEFVNTSISTQTENISNEVISTVNTNMVNKAEEKATEIAETYIPSATTTYLNNLFNLEEVEIVDTNLTLTTTRNQTPTGGAMVDGTTIVLPTIDYFTEIHLFFKADTDMTLNMPNIKYQMTTDIVGGKIYEFIFTYLNVLNEWVGGYVTYE